VKFAKAIIPMAGASHRDLPLQHVTTGDGLTRHVVALHIEDLLAAGIEQIALVVRPGAAPLFQDLLARFGTAVVLIEQTEPRGFGDAVLCAEEWTGREPFLLQVCDHILISSADKSCAEQLIDVALREECTVSAVQVTSESQLPYFGVVGGRRAGGEDHLFAVETVIEKPSPTIAEQQCVVPGLRQGTYLGFFGIHALLPSVFDHLHARQAALSPGQHLGLTDSLALLLAHEKYRALEIHGHRIDLEGPFGLLRAQLALALHGPRREEVLELMLEEMAQTAARGADARSPAR
jgi:UTP--glucose-1-phosphate uridylyltransferase